DGEYGKNKLLPPPGRQRWQLQSIVSIAAGLLEAQILRRGELLRYDGTRNDDFLRKMCEREARCYDALDRMIDRFTSDVDLAQIQLGVCCGYADFRFPQEDWRAGHPNIAKWYDE